MTVAKHDTVAALTRENGVRQIEFSDDGSFFAHGNIKGMDNPWRIPLPEVNTLMAAPWRRK